MTAHHAVDLLPPVRNAFGLKHSIIAALAAATFIWTPCRASATQATGPAPGRTITGQVADVLGKKLFGVVVRLKAGSLPQVLKTTQTDHNGQFAFRKLAPGIYSLEFTASGFKPARVSADARRDSVHLVTVSLVSTKPLTMRVNASRRPRNALSKLTGGASYQFTRENIQNTPQGDDISMRGLLTQAPGVSQDAYGQGQDQIHIHGQNGGGIQYRIDGVYMPDAVSQFGELLSPGFAQKIDLLTGYLPPEFGYRTEGVIDIHTPNGCTDPGGTGSFYGGQRGTTEASFEYAGCSGTLDYFVSGYYLRNDLGLQPATKAASPIHDQTNQGQIFSHVGYQLGAQSHLSFTSGIAVSHFQIPPNPQLQAAYSLSGISTYPVNDVADTEMEQTYFATVNLQGTLDDRLDYQVAYFSRYYRLSFNPDPSGDLIYTGIAARVLQSGFINGLQSDITYRNLAHHVIKAGLYLSDEGLESDDHASVFPVSNTSAQASNVPFLVTDNRNNRILLCGVYVEDNWRLTPRLSLIYGARWDLMEAWTSRQQLSPRINVVYTLAPSTTIHAGYASYFEVPQFDSVLAQTSRKFAGTSGATSVIYGNDKIVPESDNSLDAGLTHRFAKGLDLNVEAFFTLARHKLDLAQFGDTYVFSPLNYARARTWGTDLSLVKDISALSGYLNFSYAVLQATNVTAGQYLVDSPAELEYIGHHWIPLDDDQTFTASAGLSYRWDGFLVTADATFGSGFRNGFANNGTLPPIWQFNAAIAKNFSVPQVGSVEARLVAINLFDNAYKIRDGTGIGVSSPQWGPRRAFYGGIKVPLPQSVP
jgi:hypothetical protein